jgi:hypothetical protein
VGKFKQHFVHMFCIVVIVVARLKLLISLVVVVVVVVVVVAMSNSVPHWHVEWIRRDVVCGPWGIFSTGYMHFTYHQMVDRCMPDLHRFYRMWRFRFYQYAE